MTQPTMDYQELGDIRQKLSELGQVWLYIQEYRLTHGYLHILLTDDRFRKQAEIYMTDCLFISGPTSGGPWELEVSEMEEDGQKVLKISGQKDRFVAKGLRAQLSLRKPE